MNTQPFIDNAETTTIGNAKLDHGATHALEDSDNGDNEDDEDDNVLSKTMRPLISTV